MNPSQTVTPSWGRSRGFRILLAMVLLGLLSAAFIVQGAGELVDVGVFRPASHFWYYDYNHDGNTDARSGPWGNEGDLPVAGDFDNDGRSDDVAVFRPANQIWYYDYNHDGNTDARIGPWGHAGDLPVAGDFDSDGYNDDIGVFRPSNRTWYYDYNHDGTTDARVRPWGLTGDLPVAGDFDSDGYNDDIAIFRPSTRIWYYDYNHDGTTDAQSGPWGNDGDLPIAGDFDGDGYNDDVGVFRPTSHFWYYDYNHDGNTDARRGPWGHTGDLPFVGEFSGGVAPSGADAITAISVNKLSDNVAEVTISYNYTGSQGFPVYLGAWPTQDGTRATSFGFIPARIDAPGSGTLTVRVEYRAASCIATNGIDVFMYRGGQAPFVERSFSQNLTWGCGGGGVLPPPPPPPSSLPTINLDIDRGCGANYNPGEPLTVSFNVSETASVTLIDFETGGRIVQRALGTFPGGTTQTITGFVGGPAGVETLVLMARTLSGVYVSTGCSFAVGGVSPLLVSLTLDRGCDGTYHYGETATVTLASSVPGRASLFNVGRDGRMTQLLAGQPILPGMRLNVRATISPVTGRSTLVLQVVSSSGQRLSAACSMNVLP